MTMRSPVARGFRRALYVAILIAEAGTGIARAETLETLEPRPGVTESLALQPPPSGAPVASLVLLVGGDGRIGLRPDNVGRPFSNFVARTRALFTAQGFETALLDSPSDHRDLGDWRVSAEHANDIGAVIKFLHETVHVPVWLVSTSRGTVSAANAAARLAAGPPERCPDGVVLTSSVTVPFGSEQTVVGSSDLTAIHVPVLLVHHRDDRCRVSPPSNVGKIQHALVNAPRVEVMYFEGGAPPTSGPCRPFSQHGYLGIETAVVDAIGAWIKAQLPGSSQ